MYLLLSRKICNIIDFEIILNLLAGTQMQSELFLSSVHGYYWSCFHLIYFLLSALFILSSHPVAIHLTSLR